jgi:hypothetical protein
MDLKIGSLNFRVGSLGKNSPLRFDKIGSVIRENRIRDDIGIIGWLFQRGKLAGQLCTNRKIEDIVEELDKIMGNLALGESSGHSDEGSSRNFDNHTIAYLTTRSGGVSDSNEGMRRSEGRYTNNIHQMCVIITEAAEDDDDRNNTVVNAQGDNLGNNHRKEREKVYALTGEWKMITSAINHGTAIPAPCTNTKRSYCKKKAS